MTRPALGSTLGQLARQEIRRYAVHPLFWFGATLTLVLAGFGAAGQSGERGRTALDGLGPAFTLGVLGIVVMAGLVRDSDRAAAAAGTVTVPERTRTLALAASAVVPLTVALGWFVAAAYGYLAYPSSPDSTFAATSDVFVLTVMFSQGVVSAVGGPVLGLVLARWFPRRWVPPIVAVLVVVVTVAFNGDQAWNAAWREVWVWTHFHGPLGMWSVEPDPLRWAVLPGSVFWYVGYQLALCALGVLFAVYHDAECDRRVVVRLGTGLLAVALVLCVLAVVGGQPEIVYNPIPSPDAGG